MADRDLRAEDRAWREGYCAGRAGDRFGSCPYVHEATYQLMDAWCKGWQVGHNARPQLEKPEPEQEAS